VRPDERPRNAVASIRHDGEVLRVFPRHAPAATHTTSEERPSITTVALTMDMAPNGSPTRHPYAPTSLAAQGW
jgi:hypothetical protein